VVNRKFILILVILAILGVTKGPYLRTKLTQWYGQQTGNPVDDAPQIGLGEYLLPPLSFEAFSSDCQPFFKSILGLPLQRSMFVDFRLTHASLPLLAPGCAIASEPYLSSVDRYVGTCLGSKTESNDVIPLSCVRSILNLRAAVVDQLFPDPKFSEISDLSLLANLSFAAFLKLDPQGLFLATQRFLHFKPLSYTATKWHAIASVLKFIENGGDEAEVKTSIAAARVLYDQDPALGGIEIFFASRGFKNQNGMLAAKHLLEEFPKSAEAKEWAAYYQWAIGNRETALALYREASALEPKQVSFQSAIKALEDHSVEDDLIRGKFFPLTWNSEDIK
jgi:hypothetical protein